MTSRQLVPCPFCRNTSDEEFEIAHVERDVAGKKVPFYNVACAFGARGPDALSEEEAVWRWNRSAQPVTECHGSEVQSVSNCNRLGNAASAWVVLAPGCKSTYAEIEANAAYIVEAVNAHGRLVAENARLRDALAALGKVRIIIMESREFLKWRTREDGLLEKALEMIDAARAALGEEAANG